MKKNVIICVLLLLSLVLAVAQIVSKDVPESISLSKTDMTLWDKTGMTTQQKANGSIIDIKANTKSEWDVCFTNKRLSVDEFGNEVVPKPLCLKASPSGSVYYKDLGKAGIKFGYQIDGLKNDTPIIITYSTNPATAGFNINYQDFNETGIIYESDQNRAIIYNPTKYNGWLDPILTANGALSIFQTSNQKKIVKDSTGEYYVLLVDAISGGDLGVFLTKLDSTLTEIATYNVSTSAGNNENDPSMRIDSNDMIHVTWERHISPVGSADYAIEYLMFNATTGNDSQHGTPVQLAIKTLTNANVLSPDLDFNNTGAITVVYASRNGTGVVNSSSIVYRQCLSVCNTSANWVAEQTIINGSIVGDHQRNPTIKGGDNWNVIWYGNRTGYANYQIGYANGTGSVILNTSMINNDTTTTTMIYPSLEKEGNNLYLATAINSTTGSGGFDVVFSKYNGTNWSKWTTIKTAASGGLGTVTTVDVSIGLNSTHARIIMDASNISTYTKDCAALSTSPLTDLVNWTNPECLLNGNRTDVETVNILTNGTANIGNIFAYSYNSGTYYVRVEPLLALPAVTQTGQHKVYVPAYSLADYNLSLNWNSTQNIITDVAILYWNQTKYNSTRFNNSFFNTSIQHGVNNGSFNFTWFLNYTIDSGSIIQENSSVYNQNVSNFTNGTYPTITQYNFTETQTVNYNISLAWNASINVTNTTAASFYFNGISYPATRINMTFYTATISHGLYNTYDNGTFYTFWSVNYTVVGPSGLTNVNSNTSSISQLITPIRINKTISAFTGVLTQNILLKNEITNAVVNGTIDGTLFFQLVGGNLSFIKNYTFEANDTNVSLYKFNDSNTYLVNATIYYVATGFAPRTYIYNNASWTNTSGNITLYLLNSSVGPTNVVFTVTDYSGNRIPNAFITIQKLFTSTGTYNSVENLVTNYDGEAPSQSMILYNATYIFIVTYGGVVKLITDPTQVFRTDITLKIDLATIFTNSYPDLSMSGLISYDNVTKNATWTYIDSSGIFQYACLKVYNGETQICQNCTTSSSATLICDTSAATSGTLTIQGWIDTNTSRSGSYLMDQLIVVLSDEYKTVFGPTGTSHGMGLLAAILFVGTAGMIGLAISSSMGIVFTMVSLIIAGLLNLIYIPLPMMAIIALGGGLLIWGMKT